MRISKVLSGKGAWHRLVSEEEAVEGVVKTVILKAGDSFAAFCVRKEDLVDYKKVKKAFNTKKARMASGEEVLGVATTPPGTCCPFLVKCPVYIDPSVLSLEKVFLGSGEPGVSVQVLTKDLLSLVKPRVLDVRLER